jgi:hypothetical protein
MEIARCHDFVLRNWQWEITWQRLPLHDSTPICGVEKWSLPEDRKRNTISKECNMDWIPSDSHLPQSQPSPREFKCCSIWKDNRIINILGTDRHRYYWSMNEVLLPVLEERKCHNCLGEVEQYLLLNLKFRLLEQPDASEAMIYSEGDEPSHPKYIEVTKTNLKTRLLLLYKITKWSHNRSQTREVVDNLRVVCIPLHPIKPSNYCHFWDCCQAA